jgi:hypothetical protein
MREVLPILVFGSLLLGGPLLAHAREPLSPPPASDGAASPEQVPSSLPVRAHSFWDSTNIALFAGVGAVRGRSAFEQRHR